MICYYYYDAPTYLFFAPDIPELLYYSHIPATILALLVGIFVFVNNPRNLLNKILLSIALSFSAITVINLVTWTSIESSAIIFSWSLFGPLQGIISVLSIYFIYVFLNKEDVSLKIKTVFSLLLLPTFLFAATNLNLSGFDLAWCDSFQYEGDFYSNYYNGLGFLAILWTSILLARKYKGATRELKKQILLMGVGIESFLLLFFTNFALGDYLATIKFVEDSRLELYGFFGMGIFMVMIGVLIVRFRTFNVGMIASQAILIALLILTISQYTFAESITSIVLTSITLLFTAIIGFILLRSVRKEIKQRTELEHLTQKLAHANEKLKELDKLKSEFVSIASHQLRSPLTAIRGYASLLTDGTYGKLPAKATEALERISESSKNMAYSIEDYLNVSRIESGNMKYNYSDFNLKDEAEKVTDDLRSQAIKQGLGLIFRTNLKSRGVVHADIGKTVQIIQNLINNSIKYTPKGSIKVLVRDDVVKKRIFIDIEDTGIGMNEKTLASIFGKFERASNANSVNTGGTGLGLFVAKMMAEAMGGGITAHSEGDGKGSRFTIELPLAM
ncbi:hypothetical protein H6781_02580 [Candidatus Nomurabacteria bacterium]|nr:hypothetical protein [Candidatus Nomurabacteria bacterium]MCB9818216.1 hypothetical protein [Candidatus Nomurabacteria bacterium]